MTQLTRRSFFAKLVGAVAAAHVAPSLTVWGYSGGAHIGSIAGGLRALSPISSDLIETSALSREQIAEWFAVPADLISEVPTFSRSPIGHGGYYDQDGVFHPW